MDHGCHDEGRHFLTEHDRRFLYDAKNLTEDSASNVRTRIRERLRCALNDFHVLADAPKRWNVNHMARGMDRESNSEIYQGVVASLSLAYSLALVSDTDVEIVFEDGIRQSTPLAKDVDVDIDVDHRRSFDPVEVKEKIKKGKLPSPWEIGMLFYTGNDHVEVTYGEETKPIGEWIHEFAERRDIDSNHLDALWVDV